MVILSIQGIFYNEFSPPVKRIYQRHHDTNATLIVDGRYVGSCEEERFTRIKHYRGFPINSIDALLSSQNLTYEDVDVVSYVINIDVYNHLMIDNFITFEHFLNTKSKEIFKNAKVIFYDHHYAHSLGCFLTSNFEECNLLSIDGLGTEKLFYNDEGQFLKKELNWGFFGIGRSNPFQILKLKNFSDSYMQDGPGSINSLGNFYQDIALLSYNKIHNLPPDNAFIKGELNPSESLVGKIMGLQGYGKKIDLDAPKLISIKKHLEDDIPEIYFNYNLETFLEDYYFKYLHNLSAENLAFWGQETFENVITEFFDLMPKKYKLDNLCYSGGTALNILLNSRLLKENYFKNIHVHPATSDSGLSLGPALLIAKDNGYDVKLPANIALVGMKYDDEYIKKVFISKDDQVFSFENFLTHLNLNYTQLPFEEIYKFISNELSKNKIVAWFQGNSEFGPRALGNRSILANPCFDNKQLLNEKVKVREYWRPYACAVLQEHQNEWFDVPLQNSIYMLFSGVVKENKRGKIPAVTHVDNTCRLQAVNPEQNPHLYNLLKSFYLKTNVPLLLNTSFNTIKSEPIVETPVDAVKSFINSKIDILVINNYVITKDYNETHNGETLPIKTH